VIFKSSCSINVRYFPFDEQTCDLIFASWTFDGYFLDINVNSGEGDTTNYIKNGEWHLERLLAIKNLKKYSCCEEPYPEIIYRLVIRRRPLYYLFNMVFPCLLITFVAFLGFFLPPGSTEKVSIGITTLLSITVFLMLVAESMPPTSEQLPLLGIYYAVTIGIVSCSTAMAVLTLNINNKGINGIQVPKILKIIFLQYLAKILRTKINIKKPNLVKTPASSKSDQQDEMQSPLISFRKKLIPNHLRASHLADYATQENSNGPNQFIPNNTNFNYDALDAVAVATAAAAVTAASNNLNSITSKETKLNNKIDKLILEASDDYLINSKYPTQTLDLVDSDDNYIYYVNLNNDNRMNNSNENKLMAKAFNSNNTFLENQLLIKPPMSGKLLNTTNVLGNELRTPNNRLTENSVGNISNGLYFPGTPVCQMHCICECSNSNSNDNRSQLSYQTNCNSLVHKNSITKPTKPTDQNNSNKNNNNNVYLAQNSDDIVLHESSRKNELRRRSSQIFMASNNATNSNTSPKRYWPCKKNSSSSSTGAVAAVNHNQNNINNFSGLNEINNNNLNGSFMNDLEHILENQFNPLIETIMNVVANNEKRMEENEIFENIQNDWSNVAKVADHFLCYFFPIVTAVIYLCIFLTSPHAFTQW
jgi:hypothetical protein